MGVDKCRSKLCKQLFKLGWASICGCSHHEDTWLYGVGHGHLRPRPPRIPRHVVSLEGSFPNSCTIAFLPRDYRLGPYHGALAHWYANISDT